MRVREPVRVYTHAVFDSRRWADFVPRDDDIFVCTSMKAGTTWTQGIIASLLWPDGDTPRHFSDLSPWLDARFAPIEGVLADLDAQTHRRFIKTHTAADGIPFFDTPKYVVVGRDGRDVFMSIINHWDKMRHGLIDALNEMSGPDVKDFGYWHGDVHAFFDEFISRGSFEWEGDGSPWWSHLNHCRTWWELKDEPNVLFVHYNDLLADLDGEMRRIARFLEIDVPEAKWADVVGRCYLEPMREGAANSDAIMNLAFVGGAESFFYKGSNGRWREVLTDEEIARYEERVAEVLPPDAARWLEHGRLATLTA